MLDWLSQMKDLGLRLWLDDSNDLHYQARKGVLTSSLREDLYQKRAEIIATLKRMNQVEPHLTQDPISDSPLLLRKTTVPCQDRVTESWLLQGPLDLMALAESLRHVTASLGNLRFGFKSLEDQPQAILAPRSGVRLDIIDLGSHGLSLHTTELDRHIDQASSRPIPLNQPPLMRATILRLGSSQHVLVLVIHMLVGDIETISGIREAWAANYNKRLAHAPIRTIVDQDYLANLETQTLPFAKAWTNQRLGQHQEQVILAGPLVRRIQHLAESERVTIATLFLTAWKMVLCLEGVVRDLAVVFQTSTHERLPVRTTMQGNPCFLECLRRTNQAIVNARRHYQRRLSAPLKHMIPTAVIYSSFESLNQPELNHSLSLHITEQADQWTLCLSVDAAVVTTDDSIRLLKTLQTLLDVITQEPGLKLQSLPSYIHEGTIPLKGYHFEFF